MSIGIPGLRRNNSSKGNQAVRGLFAEVRIVELLTFSLSPGNYHCCKNIPRARIKSEDAIGGRTELLIRRRKLDCEVPRAVEILKRGETLSQ